MRGASLQRRIGRALSCQTRTEELHVRSTISRQVTPSMGVALLALSISLGGGAYAAIKLPKNSVGAKQISTA